MPKKLSVSIDFDGVIHSYTSGWTGYEKIVDPPVEGAFNRLNEYLEHFTVYIFSTRSTIGERGIKGMKRWFEKHGFDHSKLKFAEKKPKCSLYIDDRGFHFKGNFPSVEYINSFKTWNKPDGGKVENNGGKPSTLEEGGKGDFSSIQQVPGGTQETT